MGILADPTTEESVVRALQFVKVAVRDGNSKPQSGYLTDVSVAILMVEMKRRGLKITSQ